MNENSPSWIEYLDNKVAPYNMFGGNVPSLDSLVLAQLVMHQAGPVYISLNFRSLPPGSPGKWITKGCNRVQLRLSFSDVDRISIAGAYEGNLDVAASFHFDRHFLMSNSEFKAELVYGYVKAELYPFDSSIFEEPRDWFYK